MGKAFLSKDLQQMLSTRGTKILNQFKRVDNMWLDAGGKKVLKSMIGGGEAASFGRGRKLSRHRCSKVACLLDK